MLRHKDSTTRETQIYKGMNLRIERAERSSVPLDALRILGRVKIYEQSPGCQWLFGFSPPGPNSYLFLCTYIYVWDYFETIPSIAKLWPYLGFWFTQSLQIVPIQFANRRWLFCVGNEPEIKRIEDIIIFFLHFDSFCKPLHRRAVTQPSIGLARCCIIRWSSIYFWHTKL